MANSRNRAQERLAKIQPAGPAERLSRTWVNRHSRCGLPASAHSVAHRRGQQALESLVRRAVARADHPQGGGRKVKRARRVESRSGRRAGALRIRGTGWRSIRGTRAARPAPPGSTKPRRLSALVDRLTRSTANCASSARGCTRKSTAKRPPCATQGLRRRCTCEKATRKSAR